MASAGYTHIIETDLTLDTAAYADGDSMIAILALPGVTRKSGQVALLQELTLIDITDQGFGLELYFFRASVTLPALNAAWNVTDADMKKCQGVVSVAAADWIDLGINRIAQKSALGIGLKPDLAGTMYLAVRARGAGTYEAAGIRIKLTLLHD